MSMRGHDRSLLGAGAVVMALFAAAPLWGVTTPLARGCERHAGEVVATSMPGGRPLMLESLRADVARHPEDFITFETAVAAERFVAEHADARRETDRTMVERGIRGYWRGKALAVLPSLSTFREVRALP